MPIEVLKDQDLIGQDKNSSGYSADPRADHD
jgi:hypothetical protein